MLGYKTVAGKDVYEIEMSRPRYSWWGYVREILRRYPGRTTPEETDAVQRAIQQAETMDDGDLCLSIIEMVFFAKTHTLQGAAYRAHCDYETAKRWQRRFMLLVAENFKCDGLISKGGENK